jgi:CRP-like cAMP-binding protein
MTQAMAGHDPLDVRQVGHEGMLGVTLILDINRAFQGGRVHVACHALRMEVGSLQPLVRDCPMFRRGLQRYLYFVLSELSQTVGCMRLHTVPGRLARALLMVHDRVQRDDLPLMTQSMLAEMLGVQRGSVTLAAAGLQRAGVISYRRGRISILDRARLEASACACYGMTTNNYHQSLG